MKRIVCAAMVIIVAVLCGASAAQTMYEIDELGIELSLPSYVFATGRDVPPGFRLLDTFGVTESELEKSYADANIYFNALWFENNGEVSEILIQKEEDSASFGIFDLSEASDAVLHRMQNIFWNYDNSADAIAGARYYDVQTRKCDQATFVTAKCNVNTDSRFENRMQCVTIFNGQRVTVTLIEHYAIAEGEDRTALSQTISAENEDLLLQTVDSMRWTDVKIKFLEQYKKQLIFIGIGVVSMTVLFVSLKIRGRKAKLAAAAAAFCDKQDDKEKSHQSREKNDETDDSELDKQQQ